MTDQHKSDEQVKKGLADEAERRKEQQAQRDKVAKGKPTPTQEENDRAALGDHIDEHEADGGGPDPHDTRQVEAKKPAGGYQTRATEAKK